MKTGPQALSVEASDAKSVIFKLKKAKSVDERRRAGSIMSGSSEDCGGSQASGLQDLGPGATRES